MKQFEWKKIFSKNLICLLEERGMSQAQLARDSGVSNAMISDYVNERSVPGLFAVINIAYALDVNINDLVDYDERIEC